MHMRKCGSPGIWRLLALVLLLYIPVEKGHAREKKTIQKSSTDLQAKAADTYLDQSTPGSANGNSAGLRIQSLHLGNQRALIQFDLSSLPNVGIKSAILTLQVNTPSTVARTYNAHLVTGFARETDATWGTRVASKLWGIPGGDYKAGSTASVALALSGTFASWDITRDAQAWYNGTPNYGTLIKDSAEDDLAGAFTIFASKEDITPANRPQLELTFMQNVANLTATPGDGRVSLSWNYPLPLGAVLEDNVGVLILRRAGLPVAPDSVPFDGTAPEPCATIGSATVVFNDTTHAEMFRDNSSDTCGGPTSGMTWFYKIFLRDSLNNYSANGVGGAVFTPEVSATPGNTSLAQHPNWVAGTGSTTLSAPGLFPGISVMVGTQSSLLIPVDPNAGQRPYPVISLGGQITARPPIIDKEDSSTGLDVIYMGDPSGLVYAVSTQDGQIVWIADPAGAGPSGFLGAGAVVVKSFSSPAYTRLTDLLVVGTRDSSTMSGNQIFGIDGNTGESAWHITGNAPGIPALDIVSSTPMIDYGRNAVWVTSRSAGGAAQPSLWKLDITTGGLLATANLGETDSSPTLTAQGEVLFVGNNAGTVYAINPTNGATLASFAGGDGPVRGFPVVVNLNSPFQIVFSGSTGVHRISFDTQTNQFAVAGNWTTAIASPSTPCGFAGLSKVYVGSTDGKLHELDLSTGVDGKQRIVAPGSTSIVGDPSVDGLLSLIYVSATDQRIYAFAFPF
jgi:putative pyrroloquinoline-quinone binding quinoprotein